MGGAVAGGDIPLMHNPKHPHLATSPEEWTQICDLFASARFRLINLSAESLFFYVGYIETCSLHLFVCAAFFPISCKACISVTADWRFVLLVYLHSNIF